ncbi:MAG: glycosyltransferase family 4 protein [Rhizomicrobium sp.]
MRIALLVDCYPPSKKSAAKLVQDLALEFVSLGHDVLVVTVDDSLAERVSVEVDGRLTVCRIRTGRIKGANHVQRAINEIRLSSTVWKAAGRFLAGQRCDLIVYYSPTIFFGALVGRLKHLWNANSYLVLRDIFPDWALEVGQLRDGLIYRLFKRYERRNYAAADRIAVQSPANLEYLQSRADIPPAKLEVLFNWSTSELPEQRRRSFRSELGLEGKFVFFYGGNIGVAQDMDNILRLAHGLREREAARILLVGEGGEFDRVGAAIAGRGLRNTLLLPSVRQQEYLQMLQEFDAGLITLHAGLKSANIPGKLLGYLQCAMPTVASVNRGNDLVQVLEESGAGLVSINPDDKAFLGHCLALMDNAEQREAMRARARTLLIERFHVRSAAEQILRAARPVEFGTETP